MPTEATQFKNQLAPYQPELVHGLLTNAESANVRYGQGYAFRVGTGGANGLVPDIVYNQSGPTTLIPDSRVPSGMRCYVTRFDADVQGPTSWAGGTSLTLQDSAGGIVTYLPLNAIRGYANYIFPDSDTEAPLTLALATPYYANGVLTFGASSLVNGALVGTPVTVVAGTGIGQTGLIAANTATTITLVNPFPIPLDATSKVAVWYWAATAATSTTISASNAAFATNALDNGFNVAIISGTGAGQVRPISANTATQITVAYAWNAVPDTTSVFHITNNGTLLGAVDAAVGDKWPATSPGAGLQIALNGTFTGAGSPPIRCYVEGFFAV